MKTFALCQFYEGCMEHIPKIMYFIKINDCRLHMICIPVFFSIFVVFFYFFRIKTLAPYLRF